MAGDKEIQQIIKAGVDIVTAGFPCQDISYAGKGAGLEGARSGLWFDALDTIRMVGPRLALLENVPALLNRGMGEVLGGLAEGGYDAQWGCVSAADVGAKHLRKRVFILAHAAEQPEREQADEADSLAIEGRARDESGNGGEAMADVNLTGCQTFNSKFTKSIFTGAADSISSFRGDIRNKQWRVEPDVGRVADGVPRRVDRLRALGNAVVPQVAEYVGERLIEWLDSSE